MLKTKKQMMIEESEMLYNKAAFVNDLGNKANSKTQEQLDRSYKIDYLASILAEICLERMQKEARDKIR